MGDAALPSILAAAAQRRAISSEDVLAIRRAMFNDMAVSQIEAETLIALDEAALERCPEWNDLFVEALTDFMVRQRQPAGYVDDAGADWLLNLINRDGRVRTDSELDLLVHILETADAVPHRLRDFALAQVAAAVILGDGPLARSGRLETGRIGRDEVALLRRILFASGGEGNVGITRHEAETLFDINDAVRSQSNDPSWNEFFAQAIGGSVLNLSTYAPVSREVAARDEAWLNDPENMSSFVSRMFSVRGMASAFDGLFGKSSDLQAWEAQNAREDAALAEAETLTADEASWIRDRIGRDGVYDPAEKALVAFLYRESPHVDGPLEPPASILQTQLEAAASAPAAAPVFGRRRSI